MRHTIALRRRVNASFSEPCALALDIEARTLVSLTNRGELKAHFKWKDSEFLRWNSMYQSFIFALFNSLWHSYIHLTYIFLIHLSFITLLCHVWPDSMRCALFLLPLPGLDDADVPHILIKYWTWRRRCVLYL